MTTPKRYEEMARSLCRKLFASVLSQAAYETMVTNALRTAAREAQVRVLEAAQDMLIFENRAFRALVTLKERIENGEEL
jgi:hypothetical protein